MGERRRIAAMVADGCLFRAVVHAGLEPFVFSPGGTSALARSRFWRGGATVADPVKHPDRFVDDLVRIGERFADPPVLLFTQDAVLRVVSEQRARLHGYYKFLLPPADLVAQLADKAAFAQLSRRHQLPVPPTIRSDEVTGTPAALAAVGLPSVLKPVSRVSGWHSAPGLQAWGAGLGSKVLRADSEDQFRQCFELLSEISDIFVAQRYVEGGDDCIYSFHAFLDESSRPLAQFVGRKVRTLPRDVGVSSCLELAEDPSVLALGRSIATQLALAGPVKFDFKRDAISGRLYLLEINARCSLWLQLGVHAGVNLPLVAWNYLNGEAVEPQERYRTDFRWLAPATDLRAFLGSYRPSGELSWPGYLASLRGPLIYDLFAWDDPLPALARAVDQLRGRLRRLARSVVPFPLHREAGR